MVGQEVGEGKRNRQWGSLDEGKESVERGVGNSGKGLSKEGLSKKTTLRQRRGKFKRGSAHFCKMIRGG